VIEYPLLVCTSSVWHDHSFGMTGSSVFLHSDEETVPAIFRSKTGCDSVLMDYHAVLDGLVGLNSLEKVASDELVGKHISVMCPTHVADHVRGLRNPHNDIADQLVSKILLHLGKFETWEFVSLGVSHVYLELDEELSNTMKAKAKETEEGKEQPETPPEVAADPVLGVFVQYLNVHWSGHAVAAHINQMSSVAPNFMPSILVWDVPDGQKHTFAETLAVYIRENVVRLWPVVGTMLGEHRKNLAWAAGCVTTLALVESLGGLTRMREKAHGAGTGEQVASTMS